MSGSYPTPEFDPDSPGMCFDPIGYNVPLGNNPYDLQNQHEPYLAYEKCKRLEGCGGRLDADNVKLFARNPAWKLKERVDQGLHSRLLGYVLIESVNPLARLEAARMINECSNEEELLNLAELLFSSFVLVCQFILSLLCSLLEVSPLKYV